MEYLDLKAQQH